jgi:hypothetical protein
VTPQASHSTVLAFLLPKIPITARDLHDDCSADRQGNLEFLALRDRAPPFAETTMSKGGTVYLYAQQSYASDRRLVMASCLRTVALIATSFSSVSRKSYHLIEAQEALGWS